MHSYSTCTNLQYSNISPVRQFGGPVNPPPRLGPAIGCAGQEPIGDSEREGSHWSMVGYSLRMHWLVHWWVRRVRIRIRNE